MMVASEAAGIMMLGVAVLIMIDPLDNFAGSQTRFRFVIMPRLVMILQGPENTEILCFNHANGCLL